MQEKGRGKYTIILIEQIHSKTKLVECLDLWVFFNTTTTDDDITRHHWVNVQSV